MYKSVSGIYKIINIKNNHYSNNIRKNNCHPNAKLNLEKAKEIRTLYAEGMVSLKDLSKKFNVSKKTILNIIQNKIWLTVV